MLKKTVKYFLWIVAIAFLAYHSIYIKKLSSVKAAEVKAFDGKEYAKNYLDKKLPDLYANAPEINTLIALLKENPSKAFADHSNSLNKGDVAYFLVSGEAEIIKIDDVNVYLKSTTGTGIKLATEYIFGNTIRDASGLISMDEFSNSMDINTVSEEINKLIKSQVIPPFKAEAKKGDVVSFKGCIELNQTALKLDEIEVLPVYLTIKK
ncbi:MAG: DUF2291 family protein [Pyrinomonadaceae bacterium]|nr:DUF2291 family protein [Sphingobacteriaceae bacterium]